MPINIDGAGSSGTHTLRRSNINLDDNFIYFKNRDGDVIPSEFALDATFIYTSAVGYIGGISEGDLLYVTTQDPKQLTFSATSGGASVDFGPADGTLPLYDFQGTVNTVGDLPPLNQIDDAYTVTDEADAVYYWDGSAWQPDAGGSYNVIGSVATAADLPALNQTNDSYTVTADGELYFWNGSAWIKAEQYQDGAVKFNKPIVYDNRLNIDASTPTNQAVKYFTDGTPITGLTSGSTYFLKNVSISDFAGTQGLYEFTSHTFTTCGRTGKTGPNIVEMRGAYATNWDSVYLNEGDFRGYQDWTVPVSGVYNFTVAGASGYEGTGNGTAGRGAIVGGKVSLTKGEIITITVGQRGESGSGTIYGGSGGGTFVVRKASNQPLLVAGGGTADSGNNGSGQDAVLTTLGGPGSTGREAGGDEGFGGVATSGYSAAGGGFFSRGQDRLLGGGTNSLGGGSFLDGLTQGTSNGSGGYGGFGGGGQGDGDGIAQSAGAGGYSGGAGARSTGSEASGGGGGSFIASIVTEPRTSTGTFNGLTSANGEPITNIGAYNVGEGSVAVSLVSDFTTGNELYPTAVDAENGTNKIAIESAGSSFHSIVPINLDIDSDLIYSPTPHTLSDGEAISFNFTGTPPAGLNNTGIYYVNVVNAYTYRLSATPGPSYTTINLTQPAGEGSSASSLNRVVVNTATNTLTITNHGFLVDQPLQYSKGDETSTSIGGLVDGTTYYVSEVLNANQIRLKVALDAPTFINFTSPGTGTNHSFIFLTVNIVEDTLYIPNHGLVDGQRVIYTNNGNTSVQGLSDSSTYYIVVVDSSIVKLANDDQLLNIANITGPGEGTHSLVITSLDFVNDSISLPDHGFIQGELVQYDTRGQTVIAGLTANTPYYVIFVDGNNIKLATTPENAETLTAVDLQETPAGEGRHTLQSLTNTPDGIYDINSVPTPNTFTAVAKGNVPLIEKIFNPRSTLDLSLNTLFLPSHGFSTGTKVSYSQGDSATDIPGLTDGTDYYVVPVNRDYIKLATSSENAAAGVTISITGFGTGVGHSLTTNQINGNLTGAGSVTVAQGSVLINGSGTSFAKILKVGDTFRLYPPDVIVELEFTASDVDTTNDQIAGANGFSTGDSVKFAANGGVSPSPLVDGYYYFVRDTGGDAVTLHASESDAINDLNKIDFNTQGTGTSFTLTKTSPVGPIIRRITAVGSDTQVTVDRPYANAYSGSSYSFPTFVYVRPQGYSLHRPFDGGVEMSVGSGTSFGQIIRQTRKYFRYQSGKGIQTSAGINFQPSIDIESMEQFSATQVECKTRRPHGLKSGLQLEISQAEDSFGDPSQVYNGDFSVTVVDQTTFRFTANNPIVETRAYGFPQFYVKEWQGGAVRSGMFDFQNGMFYEFDGQKLYAVRRSSTQQIAGSAAALRGTEEVFGTNTKFTAQLKAGDFIVMRGQTYKVAEVESDTRLSIRPEYKGSSGTEKEFDPQTQVNVGQNRFDIIGHGFSDKLPVVYNSVDGEVIGGLVNGRVYYVNLINNNQFNLLADPDSLSPVSLSSTGTTNVHSLTPAKSGIIITKTVDTRIPQEDWSIDPCDGSGPTGYNLDLSKIQMIYMDYSWYGAGKIRFGFKTTGGQVQYTHEFVHNNNLYESYFRSGNLPARYEVVTDENPTYIPYLFHWGTSVMMDGTFDDDNAYLFTASSQTLDILGTTAKSFSGQGIDIDDDLITIQNHGFRTGDVVTYQSIAANGLPGRLEQNPEIAVTTLQTDQYMTNSTNYKVFVNSPNRIHLTPEDAVITVGATFSQAGTTITVVTAQPHGIPGASNNVAIYFIGVDGLSDDFYVGSVTVVNTTTFTFTGSSSATVSATESTTAAIAEVLNHTSQGNVQYLHFLNPEGSLNNTSGPNYQPLLSLRLSPSVSEGLTGALGDRDVINRMQLRLQEIGISTNQLVDVKLLLNPRLNNLNFVGVDSPSLTQVVEHTAADTVSGGVQVYNFRASGDAGQEESTTVDVSTLFELSNSILSGDSIFPDGPDILTIAVSRLTGNQTLASAKMSWAEAQA